MHLNLFHHIKAHKYSKNSGILISDFFLFFRRFSLNPRISSSVFQSFIPRISLSASVLLNLYLFKFSVKLYFHYFFGLPLQFLLASFHISIILGCQLPTILLTGPNHFSLLSSIFDEIPVFTLVDS